MCDLRDPNLVTFYSCMYFILNIKNTLLFTYSKNVLVCLLTVDMKYCLGQKSENVRPQLLYRKCDPIIVNPVRQNSNWAWAAFTWQSQTCVNKLKLVCATSTKKPANTFANTWRQIELASILTKFFHQIFLLINSYLTCRRLATMF